MKIIINKLHRKIKSQISLIKIKIKERKHQKRLKYLYLRKKESDTLIIVFSAFTGNVRRYNYVKALKDVCADRLYILDDFGVKGSYYLFENGEIHPQNLVRSLIKRITCEKKYKKIITVGSSKGGTCAIYFGLEFNANEIYSGACQYNLGSYLHREDHEDIFKGMMGENAGDVEARILNETMPEQIKKYSNANSLIHIVYSKQDLTYERQLVDLMNCLKQNNVSYIEKEYFFENHDEIGIYFIKYLNERLK